MPRARSGARLTVFRLAGAGFVGGDGKSLANYPDALSALHAYWDGCRGKRPFPARGDIDPIDIPTLLEHLLLVDVLERPLDLHYRLVGGHIVQHAGHNFQGKTARDLVANGNYLEKDLHAKALGLGELVSERCEPVAAHLRYHSVKSDTAKHLQMLLLPLGEEGGGVNMILAGINYAPGDP